jgi:hypothetical protein
LMLKVFHGLQNAFLDVSIGVRHVGVDVFKL